MGGILTQGFDIFRSRSCTSPNRRRPLSVPSMMIKMTIHYHPLPFLAIFDEMFICFRGVETMKPGLEWRWDTPWLGAILPVAPRTATLPADEVWLGIEKPCWLLISHIHWRIICGELNMIILKSSISWGIFNIDCGNWDDHNGNEVGNPTEILEPTSRIRWLEGQAPGLMTLESQMVEFLEDEITLQAMVIAIQCHS